MPSEKRLCFVIMGFGKKTDYSNPTAPPRTLDLDATYRAIIKPAVVAAGLRCVRADEIPHSGVIDQAMYEMLLRADLVVADISTANPNALYELGVRHALRPRTTIMIKEIEGKFIFDLNHLATVQYKHLGEDIGVQEAQRQKKVLKKLIAEVLSSGTHDSPVYTHLKGLREPAMSSEDFKKALRATVDSSSTLSKEVELAQAAARKVPTDHVAARNHFARAIKIRNRLRPSSHEASEADPYLLQQLALHTYKAKLPKPRAALLRAWKILEALHPSTSTDPETLGIGGAIQKRLWDLSKKRRNLDQAIDLYGRGFELRRDYYNGENYALCLDMRTQIQSDPGEAEYDRRTMLKVLSRVATDLELLLSKRAVSERTDYHWMLATMANVAYALKRRDAPTYEKRFRKRRLEGWMIETFNDGKRRAQTLALRLSQAST